MQRLENWDDLRFFLAVAREQGLSGAARALRVNQSTVSRRITQLEARLDARLFERHARGYRLTAVGEALLSIATKVEDDMLAVDRTVQGADRALRGTVRITTVDEVLEAIAPHLRSFREEYPGIDLEVSSALRVFSLSRHEADVAIRPGPPPTEPDVVGRKLVALPVAVYAAPEYLEARGRPRRPADLARHDAISFTAGLGHGVFGRDTLGDARVVFRANSMSGQAIAARAGLGVASLPRFIGDPDPRLERLFSRRSDVVYHLWLLIHADLRQTARVRAFVDFLTQAVNEDCARFEGTRRGRARA